MTSKTWANSDVAIRDIRAASWTEPQTPLIMSILAVFIALWTLYFTITGAPDAIHHDMAEAYVWGREFQFGYNQHPPFWAWVCGLWFTALPRAGWSFALLTSVNAAIGLGGSWMLIGDFAQGQKRVAATALLLLTPFYTFLSYRYNANSIFLSIWPWTLHFFVRSFEQRRIIDAALLGLCMGLALMSKYYALILGATCLIAAIQQPTRARYFASASPYVSAAVAAVICAPHIWWLLTTGAGPLRYLAHVSGRGFAVTLVYAGEAAVGAVAQNGLVLLVVAIAGHLGPREWRAAIGRNWRQPKFRMLATLALAPLILTVLAGLALGTKVSTNMMIGVFSLVPLLAIEVAGGQADVRVRRASVRLAAALMLAALAFSPAIALAKAWLDVDGAAVEPRKELAKETTRLWRAQSSQPLLYVAGTFPYDNAVAFYSADRPHSFERFDFLRNRWVTLGDLAEHGLLAVCVKGDEECLASTARFATKDSSRTELVLAHSFFGRREKPVSFTVTITPPRDER